MLDWRGTKIDVGDTVVYPTRYSSYMGMREGTVIDLHEENRSRVFAPGTQFEKVHNWVEKTIKVRGTHGKIVRPDADRVTVVEKKA